MDTILAWLANTKIGRFCIGVGAVLLMLGAALAAGLWKGQHDQKEKDDAKEAKQNAAIAEKVKDTYKSAVEAATKVREDAKKQPPPDPVKRDDLDNDF